jgi:hypothetical protein
MIAVLALLSSSCGYVIDATKVRAQFATDQSCPRERVTVRERPAPDAPVVAREPPSEIAADPQRLALWQAAERARQARVRREQRDDFRVYEVEGCNIRQTLTCSRYRQRGRWPCSITQ